MPYQRSSLWLFLCLFIAIHLLRWFFRNKDTIPKPSKSISDDTATDKAKSKQKKYKQKGYASLTLEKRWALALTQPMGEQFAREGLDLENPNDYEDEILENLTKSLKIHLGLRQQDNPNLNDFTAKTRQEWYKWVIERLHPDDDWRDGLAFACGRTAFILRASYLVGWLDRQTQWQLLLLNAQRTQRCFNDWEDFAMAWSRGRTAWIKRSQTDNHGVTFTHQQVQDWLNDPEHIWHGLPWQCPSHTMDKLSNGII